MFNLFIDAETIPTQRNDLIEEVRANLKPPGNIKKQESIDAWFAEKSDGAFEEAYRKTSFDGAVGELICLSFAIDGGEIMHASRDLGGSESYMLDQINELILDAITDANAQTRIPTWVGHNICEFDLRFLWQRMVINKVKPLFNIPYNQKPWGNNVFDTLYEWKGLKSTGGSLDRVCKAFGIPGKGDLDGSKVWDYYKAGRIDEIVEYCDDDVHKVREIYRRMNFWSAE